MTQITISEWAATHSVPLRTAQQWAKDGTIPARKKKIAYQIITDRLIKTWVVDSDTNPPSEQEDVFAR